MIKFSEYVSIGHPDKIADYISQYLLDRYIEQDPDTRYAVEVQIKDNLVTLGGEISSKCHFTTEQIAAFCRKAVNEIGYTIEYAEKWGIQNTICGDSLLVTSHIRQQSADIAQGLSGWGDQGIFFGYAAYDELNPGFAMMPYEHTVAKRLCKALFDSKIGGLDIKTQVITEEESNIKTIIVAIPLLDKDTFAVERFVRSEIPGDYELIVNGTGKYVQHSSMADCGTTGRKLAVDFYGGACRIGGGSPWTKDASKADLTLNLAARKMAITYAKEHKCNVFTSLACCIGKQAVSFSVSDDQDNIFVEGEMDMNPALLKTFFGLDKPIFASMCRWGLFGEFQSDKEWER